MSERRIYGTDGSRQLELGFDLANTGGLRIGEDVRRGTITTTDSKGREKIRKVWKPSKELREEHREMLDSFQSFGQDMPWAFGGVGKSLETHARAHLGGRYFYQLDLRNAYAAVDISQLTDLLVAGAVEREWSKEWQQRVVSFVEERAIIDEVPGLPLGLPASPFLFNYYCSELDKSIAYVLGQGLHYPYESDYVYTRWLDDLTISSHEPIQGHARRVVREIIGEHGFEIAQHKSKLHDRAKGPVTVTGVSIYPDGHMLPAPHLIGKARSAIDRAEGAIERGEEFDEEEFARLVGYKSVLHVAGDPIFSMSRTVRGLAQRYSDFLAAKPKYAELRHDIGADYWGEYISKAGVIQSDPW